MFAKALTGFNESIGWASRWPVTSQEPSLNGAVVFTYNHVAVVEAIRETEIDIIEANYVHGQISHRTLQLTDPTIRGYWTL